MAAASSPLVFQPGLLLFSKDVAQGRPTVGTRKSPSSDCIISATSAHRASTWAFSADPHIARQHLDVGGNVITHGPASIYVGAY